MEEVNLLAMDGDRVLSYLLTADQPEWAQLLAHPNYSEKWIVFFLRRTRPIPRRTLEEVHGHRVFRKNYQINLALMCCKTTPPHISMKLAGQIRWPDLFKSLRLPHLPGAVRQKVERQLMEIIPRLAVGEQVALARQAPRPLVRHLRLIPEARVITALLQNYHFTYEDALFVASYAKIGAPALEALAQSPKWTRYREVRLALARNPRLPHAMCLPLLRLCSDHDCRQLLRMSDLPTFSRRLLHRLMEQRFEEQVAGRREQVSQP